MKRVLHYLRPSAVFLRKLRCRGFGQILNSRNIGSCPRGFTLIEVIVSLVIMSLSLAMIMQLFSAGLKASRASCDYTRAVIYAKNIMEETSGSSEQESGEFEDGFLWETEVMPYEDSEGMVSNLMRIKVKVSWHDVLKKNKVIELVSLRVVVDEDEL